jgi:hypothetical protein
MLSLAGDMPDRAGVGVGEGFCSSDTSRVLLAEPTGMRPGTRAAAAMANVLIDKPAIHASAHVRMAAFFRGRLGIIPSSGDLLNFRPRARSKCPKSEHSKHAPHNAAAQSYCQK